MERLRSSVLAAGQYPVKLINLMVPMENKVFKPTHLSVNITNKCNLDCPYCSNKDRDLDEELSCNSFMENLEGLIELGGLQAVTFTGGGEPTLHPRFEDMVGAVLEAGLAVGLITNGTTLATGVTEDLLNKFAWIRISIDGFRKKLPELPSKKKIAFSWVWEDGDDRKPSFKELICMADQDLITHLRIGSNIYKVGGQKLPFHLEGVPRVVVHDRSEYTIGTPRCWTGLIWPKLDVDGMYMACCGHQYAHFTGIHGRNDRLALGRLEPYLCRAKGQISFEGSGCERCYYSHRNAFLDAVKEGERGLLNPEFS